jgi:large subunit ribosomal protein L10
MMPNAKNVESVGELTKKFRETRSVFLTDYRGLKVSDLASLRRQLREAEVDYRVAKNTLMLIASEQAGMAGLGSLLTGPSAVAFVNGDEIAAARALTDFARTSRILTVKGGVLGTQILTAENVADVARLPAKSILRADLAGAVQGPMVGLIGVLNAALSGVVHALEERAKQLEPA